MTIDTRKTFTDYPTAKLRKAVTNAKRMSGIGLWAVVAAFVCIPLAIWSPAHIQFALTAPFLFVVGILLLAFSGWLKPEIEREIERREQQA